MTGNFLNRGVFDLQHRRSDAWRRQNQSDDRLCILDLSAGDHFERIGDRKTHDVDYLVIFQRLLLAVSLALCAIHTRFRDVGVALPLLLQVWFFASPVLYPLDTVPAAWRGWYALNPMAGVIDGFRWSLLGTASLYIPGLIMSCAFAVVLLVTAIYYFKNMEREFADLI